MNVLLPYIERDRDYFMMNADILEFNHRSARKFLYINFDSDAEDHSSLVQHRLCSLLYAWKLCERYKIKQEFVLQNLRLKRKRLQENITHDVSFSKEFNISQYYNEDDISKICNNVSLLMAPIRYILRIILPCSLQIWFSHEWKYCHSLYRNSLLHCLIGAKDLLRNYYPLIDWNYWFELGPLPFSNCSYLLNLNIPHHLPKYTCIDYQEKMDLTITKDDMQYIDLEQLALITLRALKLFDSKSFDLLKEYCIRVINAWVIKTSPSVTGEKYMLHSNDISYLLNICHIYLMTVYESDHLNGFIIDNLIDDICFYLKLFYEHHRKVSKDILLSPARVIALLCYQINIRQHDFFTAIIDENINRPSNMSLSNSVTQTYRIYLLAFLLIEWNLKTDTNISSNYSVYILLFEKYIRQRTLCDHLLKANAYKNMQTIAVETNSKNSLNYNTSNQLSVAFRLHYKGNYSRIIEDYLDFINLDYGEVIVDPVFLTLPNNDKILHNINETLSTKTSDNWYYGKVMVLLTIIYNQLNTMETYRYKKGITTELIINLEENLSQYYRSLAQIFVGSFLEREFWLTAFYLNPTESYYEEVVRCGKKSIKNYLMETFQKNCGIHTRKKCLSSMPEWFKAKFELLSSTTDVEFIAKLTNQSTLLTDYQNIQDALKSLHLPESVIRDLLTAIFIPRNKTYSWAINWGTLRNRCTRLFKKPFIKNDFIALNMADANSRLKYINIDYSKYKNRPQLNYGTIEVGFEKYFEINQDANANDIDYEEFNYTSFEEDDEMTDYSINDDNERSDCEPKLIKSECCDKFSTTMDTASSEIMEEGDVHKIRTRAQTKLLKKKFNNKNFTNDTDKEVLETRVDKTEIVSHANNNENLTVQFKQSPCADEKHMNDQITTDVQMNLKKTNVKRSLDVVLKERPVFMNNTPGFIPITDIWNVDRSDLELIDTDYICYTECDEAINFIKENAIDEHYRKYDKPLPVTSTSNNSIAIQKCLNPTGQQQFSHDENLTEILRKQFLDANIISSRSESNRENSNKGVPRRNQRKRRSKEQLSVISGTSSSRSESYRQNSKKCVRRNKRKRQNKKQLSVPKCKKLKTSDSSEKLKTELSLKNVKVRLEKLPILVLPKLKKVRVSLKHLSAEDFINYGVVPLSNPEQHPKDMQFILDEEKSIEVCNNYSYLNRPRSNTLPAINMEYKNRTNNQTNFKMRSRSLSPTYDGKIFSYLDNNDCYSDKLKIGKHKPIVTKNYDKSEGTGTCIVIKKFNPALKNIAEEDELVDKNELIKGCKTTLPESEIESIVIIKADNHDVKIMPNDENSEQTGELSSNV